MGHYLQSDENIDRCFEITDKAKLVFMSHTQDPDHAERMVGLSKGRSIHLGHSNAAGCGTHGDAKESMERIDVYKRQVVGNVLTMAITGIIICQVCHILPCLERVPSKTIEKDTPELSREEELERMLKPTWFVRRVLADFSEPQFYGNEIAGLFIILGACLEWFLNSGHGAYASGTIPAIILSQFIAGGVGVYLLSLIHI